MTTSPTEAPITPLRQRMVDDMAMRSMRARTQQDYVRHVRAFTAFLQRPPDTATAEDVWRFQVHQREHGASESVISATVSALRFLFGVTLDRPNLLRKLVLAPRPRKLPDVLSVDEVARLLEAAPGIKYRAALGVAYGAGLRVSEVAQLKADDIDSKRMLIRVEEGTASWRPPRSTPRSPHARSARHRAARPADGADGGQNARQLSVGSAPRSRSPTSSVLPGPRTGLLLAGI